MIEVIKIIGVLVVAYLSGSIPWGLIIVRLRTGKDIREFESGRTGGTNVGRVAGFWAGALTAFLDGAKGTIPVWLAIWLLPDLPITHAISGFLAVIGHNYSIFLMESHNGRIRLRGGAGGATVVGASFGLWWPSIIIVVPLGLFILLIVGYASVATMSVGFVSTLVFLIRAILGLSPWAYILYGILATFALVWALRPNIVRLRNGTERIVGIRAKRMLRKQEQQKNNHPIR